jgi:hypothetical protein
VTVKHHIEEVLKCKHLKGWRTAPAKGKEGRQVNKGELKAFIGLTLFARVEKSWDISTWKLFLDPLQNPMYKATMSVGRYEDIHCYLRLDDKRTRVFREATDHLAAVRCVWDLFLANCRRRSIPSNGIPVDEQLVPFWGRSRFTQYLHSKPDKYGIKIFWVCDARVPYAIDGIGYTGRQSGEEVQKNLGESVVPKLCSGLRQTGELFSLRIEIPNV